MPNITLKGTIKTIFPAEVYGSFEKRVFWLQELDAQYPNTWALEMHQGECNNLDKYQPGDKVECHVDIKGRRWEKNGKEGVINTLKVWRINKIKEDAPAKEEVFQAPDPVDDLPF